MRCHGEVERLDGALASFAGAEAGLRLRLGQVLEVLGRGKHFELGFSSIAAYALERCDRSVRWVEAARCLARRLEPLPELRRAVACGGVSWSMGELLARVAQPRDEAQWIEAAASRTVREMRGLVEAAVNERATGRAVLKRRDGGGAVLGEPASDGLALGEPALGEPALGEPASDEPVSDEPVSDEQALGAPVSDEQVLDVPALDVPALDVPALDVPALGEPGPDEPALCMLASDGLAAARTAAA